MSDYNWTEKQGQYLAFIYNYSVIHGQPPAESDMERFFRVSPPSVHQMVLTLEKRGFISRVPRQPRTIQVLVPPDQLPLLKPPFPDKEHVKPANVPIYQIKVSLKGSKPPIWRRIQVRSDVTLARLHQIIQTVMDWYDEHLHQFIVGETYYSIPKPTWGFNDVIDERGVRLDEIVTGERFRFVYEYDFGDSWQHTLLVEKVLEPEPERSYPICLEGRRACPPEDIGGIWAYNYLIESTQNPEHPDYPGNEDFLEWVGEGFDPEEFDLEEINEALKGL